MSKRQKLTGMEGVEPEELRASEEEPYSLEHLDSLRNEVFSNDLIFKNFLKLLTITDLKPFRHVCSNWHHRSQRVFYKKACVHFKPWQGSSNAIGACPKQFTADFYPGDLDNSENSSNNFEKLDFQRCTLNSWDWSDGLKTGEDKFWEAFGPQIKYLRLHKCMLGFGKFDHLIRLLRGDLTPNLHTLVLESCDFHVYSDFQMPISNSVNSSLKRLEITGPTPFFDWLFLRMFPNLEELMVAKMSSSEHLLDQISTLRARPRLPQILNISKLDLLDTDQSLAQFPADLPLKELSFRISRSLDTQQLLSIFRNYSDSLEKLCIFRTPNCEDIPFPNFEIGNILFPKLEAIELWGNFAFNFNFLKCTPVLKKFRLEVQCYDKREIIDYYYSRSWKTSKYCKTNSSTILRSVIVGDAGGFALGEMRELVMDVKVGVDDWWEVKDWMPGLTKIMAPLDNSTLQVVCSNWGRLEDLKLRFPSDVDDSGITGYANPEADNATFPNITDLKHLKSFETEVRCGTAKLTDFSATMGFLKMSSLLTLRIYVSNKMTEEMIEKLQEGIPNVRVLRSYWVGSDSPEDRQECCNWARHHYRFFTCRCENCQPNDNPVVPVKRIRRRVVRQRRPNRGFQDFARLSHDIE